jgi:Arc/MetJ-type ribon-helix-helix transcriptional regulator
MAKTPRLETVQIRLSPDLMRRIDELRAAQEVRPSRSAAVRYLIERGIAAEEAEAREHREKLAQKAADGGASRPLSKQAIGETAPHGPPERL